MEKLAVIGIVLFCLSTALVFAEDSENKNQNILLSTNLENNHYLDINFDHLFAVDKQIDCSEKDKVTVLYNISKNNILIKEELFTRDLNSCTKVSASTGDFTPIETGNYTLCGVILNSTVGENNSFYNQVCNSFEVLDTFTISCDITLQLKTNETIFYENGQSIEFKPELSDKSFPFVIEYWIEDLFGNIVKPKLNTTNTNEKSWKTNIKEQDRVLFLKAMVYPACNDGDYYDNVAEKMFIVTKNEATTTSAVSEETVGQDSSIEIIKITPEKTSFGESLHAEIEIYKGDTGKYSVSLWVEKDGKAISEKSKVHLKNKDTLYKFSIPVLLDANCNEKIKDGGAQLIVEGLGILEEKKFVMEGINKKNCPEENENTGSEKSKNSFQIIDLPAEISPGEILRINFEVKNNEDEKFESWSYLYRGSKCYSCAEGERDENKISFLVDKDETKLVKMIVTPDQELAAGEYNLMVKYKKEGQKTEHSISEKIIVIESTEKAKVADQTLLLLSQPENAVSPLISEKNQKKKISNYKGIVVYESVSERSKNLVSWALLIAFGLLSLVLIIKRR